MCPLQDAPGDMGEGSWQRTIAIFRSSYSVLVQVLFKRLPNPLSLIPHPLPPSTPSPNLTPPPLHPSLLPPSLPSNSPF
jgi:hypothetical protein